MEFLFDCVNLETIRRDIDIFPITGVTSNPSIIKAEGKIDFFNHFEELRRVIGFQRSLHIQVLAEDCNGILADAETILEQIDDKVFIKIPTTEQGLKAMRILKAQGVGVTATAIYSKIQGFMAIACGADYIAPYYTRMENVDVNPKDSISAFAQMIEKTGAKTKVLAASFKDIAQVNAALMAGSHAVTLTPELLHHAFNMAATKEALATFEGDWTQVFGRVGIPDLYRDRG